MAIILKEGKTFDNPYAKDPITTAYGVIDQVNGNKGNCSNCFVLEIYPEKLTKEERRSGLVRPIFTDKRSMPKEDFDSVFGAENLNKEGMNPNRAVYEYLLQMKDNKDNLIYADWKSDEE